MIQLTEIVRSFNSSSLIHLCCQKQEALTDKILNNIEEARKKHLEASNRLFCQIDKKKFYIQIAQIEQFLQLSCFINYQLLHL